MPCGLRSGHGSNLVETWPPFGSFGVSTPGGPLRVSGLLFVLRELSRPQKASIMDLQTPQMEPKRCSSFGAHQLFQNRRHFKTEASQLRGWLRNVAFIKTNKLRRRWVSKLHKNMFRTQHVSTPNALHCSLRKHRVLYAPGCITPFQPDPELSSG